MIWLATSSMGSEGSRPTRLIYALQGTLLRVVDSRARVDGGDGAEADAAAALLAAQVPGSEVVIDPEDALEGPLPQLPVSLRPLAAEALHRALSEGSELARGWVDGSEAAEWRQEVHLMLRTLE
ncbi:DUF4259 domain-containing protein [Streptomyces sp. PmtG]